MLPDNPHALVPAGEPTKPTKVGLALANETVARSPHIVRRDMLVRQAVEQDKPRAPARAAAEILGLAAQPAADAVSSVPPLAVAQPAAEAKTLSPRRPLQTVNAAAGTAMPKTRPGAIVGRPGAAKSEEPTCNVQ